MSAIELDWAALEEALPIGQPDERSKDENDWVVDCPFSILRKELEALLSAREDKLAKLLALLKDGTYADGLLSHTTTSARRMNARRAIVQYYRAALLEEIGEDN